MAIVSNASPEEKESAYFVANERLCKQWETYFERNGSEASGKYNAWSFYLEGEIQSFYTWNVVVKKATFSGGNILLSSRYQNLQEILSLTADVGNVDCKSFRIHRSSLKARSRKHRFYDAVKELLSESLEQGCLYEAVFKNQQLKIVFHHKNDGFEMVDRILKFAHGR